MAKKIRHRNIPDKNYAWQAHSLYEYFDEVGIGGIALYGLLTTYDYGTHIVFPSRRTLARRMKVGRNTISEYLTRLEKAKLIELEKRYGKRNRLPDYIHLLKIKQRGVALKSSHPKVALKSSHGGSKSEPEVARKVSRNKKNRIRRTKEENIVAKKHRNNECVPEDLFDDDKNKLNKQKLKDSFEYKYSVQLYNALKSKGKIIQTKINIKEWVRHFRELRQVKSKRRIKIVLHWYLKHFTEKWCPKLYCARTFKEHFARIENAMKRKGDEALLEDEREEETEVETSEYTDSKGQKHTVTKTHGEDDFPSETDVWIDKDGQKHGTDSIDYSEPEQDEDEDED